MTSVRHCTGCDTNVVRIYGLDVRTDGAPPLAKPPEHMRPHSFHWCVRNLDLGDRDLTRVVKAVCNWQTLWPEQLLGRPGAGAAVSGPKSPPLSTGHSPEPRRETRFAEGRRLCWRLGYLVTDLSIENIAELVGGYSAAYVRPWATSWKRFADAEGDRWPSWRLWIGDIAETLGVAAEDMP